MSEFEVTITSTFVLEFDGSPGPDDVIRECRRDPHSLLSVIEVENIDEI